ncbi:MAG: thermonuclease family protein [Halodesulfurarchaeum sp.]
MNRAVVAMVVVVVSAGCAGLSVDLIESSEPDRVDATVIEVIDGDTIDVRYSNGNVDTVRLLGVDSPETFAESTPAEFEGVPDTETGRECLRSAGDDATNFTTRSLLGEEVTLVIDRDADRRDRYDRLLAYVYLEDENFNYRLVAAGHARVYDSEFTESDRFYAAETEARSSQIGVWRCTREEALDVSIGSAIDATVAIALLSSR